MSFQVVEPKQQIDFVVFKNSERALNRVFFAAGLNHLHLCQMDATQNPAGTNTNRHACKPGIQQSQDVASLGAVLAHDCGLGSRVDEGLHWDAIYFGLYVEHCDATEELRTVFNRHLVVVFNHVFTNELFNLPLGFHVVGRRILEPKQALLLLFLLVHLFFEPLADDRLQLTQVVGRQSCVHFRVLLGNPDFKVGVLLVERADLVSLGPDSLLLRIVEHLVKNASLAPTLVKSWLLIKVAEEVT